MLLSDGFYMSENSIDIIVYDEKVRDWYAQDLKAKMLYCIWGCGIVSFDGD